MQYNYKVSRKRLTLVFKTLSTIIFCDNYLEHSLLSDKMINLINKKKSLVHKVRVSNFRTSYARNCVKGNLLFLASYFHFVMIPRYK